MLAFSAYLKFIVKAENEDRDSQIGVNLIFFTINFKFAQICVSV